MHLRLCVTAVNERRCHELRKNNKEVTYKGVEGGKKTKI